MTTDHASAPRPFLQVRNLSVVLRGRRILDDQSLEAQRGEIVVIFGPSGSGKTTFLRAIARLQRAERGEIRVGSDIYSLTEGPSDAIDRRFYPAVCYVPQTLALWPHLTNRANVALPLGHNHIEPAFADLIDQLDLRQVLDQMPSKSSHGQRQRVALLRALVLDPRVLLLDEATSALDRQNVDRVAALLQQRASNGDIIVAVTHDNHFARTIATRSFALNSDGRLCPMNGSR